MGRETYIAYRDKNFLTPDTPAGLFYKYRRLSRVDRRSSVSERQVLSKVAELRRVGGSLGLSRQVVDRAVDIFLSCLRRLGVRGVVVYSYMCASLVIACRDSRIPPAVSFDEVYEVFRRNYRVSLSSVFRAMYDIMNVLGVRARPKRASDYIVKFVRDVVSVSEVVERLEVKGLDREEYCRLLLRECFRLLKVCKDRIRGSARPRSVACAVLYGADKIVCARFGVSSVLTISIVSRVFGVGKSTIRRVYAMIRSVVKRLCMEAL